MTLKVRWHWKNSINCITLRISLLQKCPYSEFFWFTFSHIWTEYGEIRSIYPYLVKIRENTNRKNYEYGHVSLSTYETTTLRLRKILARVVFTKLERPVAIAELSDLRLISDILMRCLTWYKRSFKKYTSLSKSSDRVAL